MNFSRCYIVLFLLSLLSACEQNNIESINNQIPQSQVIKAIVEPDNTITAYCSRVAGITQPYLLESGISIKIKSNKFPTDQWFNFTQLGIYQWDCTLKPRDSFIFTYRGVLDTISVADKIPSAIRLQSVDTSTSIVPGIGKTQVFTIQFRDSAIDKNWYQLLIKRQFIKYIFPAGSTVANDSQLLTETVRIDGNELPFIRNTYNNYTDKSILFSDEIFNGVNAKFQCHNLKPWSNSPQEKTLSVEVILENLSQPLYNYLNTEAAHLWQKQSVTQLPNPLFSNIPNGFGIVGSKTTDRKIIVYPR